VTEGNWRGMARENTDAEWVERISKAVEAVLADFPGFVLTPEKRRECSMPSGGTSPLIVGRSPENGLKPGRDLPRERKENQAMQLMLSMLLLFQAAGWDAGFMNLYADMTGTLPKVVGPIIMVIAAMARDHIHNERVWHFLMGLTISMAFIAWSPQIFTFLT
jgi:hypothetical protein